jgi:hypothetical protein
MSQVQNRDRLHVQPETPHGEDTSPAFETPAQEQAEDYRAVRVHVTNPVATSTADVQFGIYETVVLPGSGNQQILPRDPLRQYAYIMSIDEPIVLTTTLEASQATVNQGTAPANVTGYGTATSPGAFTNVAATSALPAGLYTVTVTGYLSGTTAAATDDDNMQLVAAAAGLGRILVNTGGGVATLTVPYQSPGGVQLIAQTIGAGTAASVYHASIVAVPQGADLTPNPAGSYLPALVWTPPIRHNDPVYAANTSATPTRVVFMVERGAQE